MSVDHKKLVADARAFRAAGRHEDAIPLLHEIVALLPASGVAEHNLAAALADADRWEEAEPHIRQAFAKGVDAPETWLVLARIEMMLCRFAQSEHAFLQVLRRRPDSSEAHRELAQLRWMTSGSLDTAMQTLEMAIRVRPADVRLQTLKARVLENVGQIEESHRLAMRLHQAWPKDAVVATLACNSALSVGKVDLAMRIGAEAERLAPHDYAAVVAFCESCLANGQAQPALDRAERLQALMPNNQHAIAIKALAWRLLNDHRYKDLFNYESLVMTSELTCPQGWPSLEVYLADVANALAAAHTFRAHPFGQSIKGGTQVASILTRGDPAIKALPEALDPSIRKYLDHIGAGADPLRARNTGRYRFKGVWSIRMRSGGLHVNHIHPEGWISSTCYLAVPTGASGKEGWIKFGEPRAPTNPPCPPEYFIEPKPGRLVLFPSYMWHGTIPFTGDGVRMTFAMDVLPN